MLMCDATQENFEKSLDEYWRFVDLWRFYLELIIKVNVFYAGISGGLVAYVMQNVKNHPGVQIALLPPFLLSVGCLLLTFIGIFQSQELGKAIDGLAHFLKIKQPLHSELLMHAMILSAIFYLLCACGIGSIPFVHKTMVV